MPPGSGFASRISTSCPNRRKWYAHDRPAGPAPTTSTRLPVGGPGAIVQPFSLARSPRKRSSEWIETADRGIAGCRRFRRGDNTRGRACRAAGSPPCTSARLPRSRLPAPARARPGCSPRPDTRGCRAEDDRQRQGAAIDARRRLCRSCPCRPASDPSERDSRMPPPSASVRES